MAKTLRMSGKALQKAILEEMAFQGWRACHFQSVLATGRDGKPRWRTPFEADGKGWPDIFAVRRTRAIAVEVKGDGDKIRPEQEEWLASLAEAGIETYLWTPKSLRSGGVNEVLR
jgi:hypothetical protein